MMTLPKSFQRWGLALLVFGVYFCTGWMFYDSYLSVEEKSFPSVRRPTSNSQSLNRWKISAEIGSETRSFVSLDTPAMASDGYVEFTQVEGKKVRIRGDRVVIYEEYKPTPTAISPPLLHQMRAATRSYVNP